MPGGLSVSSVLVIDDERQIRRLLRVSLESRGFVVNEAATGEDGIRAVQGLKPDVVLLDLGLPDMDGLGSWPPCGSGPACR